MKVRLVERLSALGPIIEDILSVTGTPSAALGVSYHGEIIHQANFGFRDVKKHLPPDSDTVYGIGSITKVFTASAIGILVEEGSVNWTTPVLDVLSDLRSTSDFVTSELTVVDLLSHSTALTTSNNWWYGSHGVLLLDKNQTLPYFNALKPVGSLRSRYDYSNWNFAILGEVIEKLSGKSYGSFIKDKILDPLGMSRTSVSHIFDSDENLALPYAILDDRTPYQLPPPQSEDGKIMASAQAIQSTVTDLLRFTQALLRGYGDQLERQASSTPGLVLKNVVKQFTGHSPRGSPSMLQKEYCLGMHRHQLPNAFDGLGCNAMFVEKMPILTPGGETRLVLSHGGSLAGYSTFMALLPEMNCSIAVFVNSIGLSDPAGWLNQLLLETLIDTPKPNDYVSLAKEAAGNHASSFAKVAENFKKKQLKEALPRPLSDYAGLYQATDQDFFFEIQLTNDTKSQLQVVFQGLDSQTWELDHYQENTFLLPISFNEFSRRAMFTFVTEDFFRFTFESGDTGNIDRVCWPQDPNLPANEQYFMRVESKGFTIQRPILKI